MTPSLTYDETQLRQTLEVFDHRQQVLFAVFCAERLLPNYRRFAADEAWGDIDVLRSGVAAAWHWLASGEKDAEQIQRLMDQCDEQAPDTEDFETTYVSAALDAASTVAFTLELLETRDTDLAATCGNLCIDTVDLLVQEQENLEPDLADLEERIRLHPLMQQELSAQQAALNLIASHPPLDQAEQLWRDRRSSNLELE